MARLFIPIGGPGSGKSTLAWHMVVFQKLDPTAIVSPDEYRRILTGDSADQSVNEAVFEICHKILDHRLAFSQDVYFDATNASKTSLNKILGIGRLNRAETTVINFDTDLDQCRAYNADRSRVVPDDVVIRMHGAARALMDLYTFPDWVKVITGAEANASLSKTGIVA